MARLGIIAGGGAVPITVYRRALELGEDPCLLAIAETTAPEDLKAAGLPFDVESIGKPQSAFDALHAAGADRVLIVGKVPKELHAEEMDFDERAMSVLMRLQSRSDTNLFAALAEEFEADGFTLAGQKRYLAPFVVEAGVICGAGIPEGREDEARRAVLLAKRIAELDIGQTVVTYQGAVVAVEAFEHTNETIRRAGTLAGRGCWIAKAARPGHDDRFDVPSVGETTVRVMGEAGADLLLIEAKEVFLFERDEAVAAADQLGISIVGVAHVSSD